MTRAQLRVLATLLLVVSVAMLGAAFAWWLLWLAIPVYYLVTPSHDGFAMHPHTLTLLVTVTLVLAVLVGLVLGFVGLRLL